ncbi:dickkopf-related protein 3-like [Rhinoraja longicauda]
MCRAFKLTALWLCFMGLVPAASGYIWAWILSLPYKGTQDVSATRNSEPLPGQLQDETPCKLNQDCSTGLFCDKHFGRCVSLREQGHFCRQDLQCAQGLSCLFGQCQLAIPERHEGARCRLDEDCAGSMCCARHHGEMICKKKLTFGMDCYVPDGGLAYSINQLCPCDSGLVCSSSRVTREKEFDHWGHTNSWQCLNPSLP